MLSDISNKQIPLRNTVDKSNSKNTFIKRSANNQKNKRQYATIKGKQYNNIQQVIQDSPDYKFHALYEQPHLAMFPFLEVKNLRSEDDIDFTNSIRYPKNQAKKFNKPLSQTSEDFLHPESELSNPLNSILKNSRENSFFEFGNQKVHLGVQGSVETREIIDLPAVLDSNNILNTPSGSKRPIDHVDAFVPFQNSITPVARRLLINSTPTPLQRQVVSSIKKRKYDRLDNSMVISAKAIMKMVDESLVSSDSDTYSNLYSANHSHSLSSIHRDSFMREKSSSISLSNSISINADDLHFAKLADIENDDDHLTATPIPSKIIKMNNSVVQNRLRKAKQ